ncbi:MAG TPA: hypothetical protein ENN49_06745 [Bacteroidales bacterium]|nr:hypothetical protein [Bacteroidales bacterium]
MKRLLLLLLAATVLVGGGCASKKYAKKGMKFEQAGLWEQAADAYLRSLTAKRDNIDAIVGLKRAGQRVLDERSLKVIKAYENDDLKQAVYTYLDAENFKNQAASLGVELSISNMATDYFNDAKPKYVEKIYIEAQTLLDAEKFKDAELLLTEVKRLQPGYGNTQDMLKVSKCEPLYRQAKQFMDAAQYRKAYANLDRIVKEFTNYKDSRDLRDEALQKATITIRVTDFKSTTYNAESITKSVQAEVVSKLNALNNPFIKVIDVQSTDKIIEEQQRSVTTGSDLEIGKLLAAKALLSGDVSVIEVTQGKLNKTKKRGYIREETKTKDPKTGEEKVNVTYRKVIYWVYNQKNSVSVALKFQLTSTETGAVMVSDFIRSNQADEIYYATFDGPTSKLVPGYWEKINADSPKDVVNDNQADVRSLQELLKAKRDITGIKTLTSNAIEDIAKRTAQKINQYNPEE